MKALRVAGWSRFEKSDHKKCKNMTWVATPTSHDGIGFLRLLTSPEGLRRYGGWHLILQVAARCPTHGLLVSDSGRSLGAAEIALKTRANESDISDAITACLEIGWLEEIEIVGKPPEASGGILEPSCLQDRTGQDKTGEGGSGNSGATPTPPPPPFPILQAALKAAKVAGGGDALQEWVDLTTDHCGCEYDADAAEAVTWMIKRARAHGTIVRWAREVADQAEDCRRHITAWKKGAA